MSFPTATLKIPSIAGILEAKENLFIISSISSSERISSVVFCIGVVTIIFSPGPLHSIVFMSGSFMNGYNLPKSISTFEGAG